MKFQNQMYILIKTQQYYKINLIILLNLYLKYQWQNLYIHIHQH